MVLDGSVTPECDSAGVQTKVIDDQKLDFSSCMDEVNNNSNDDESQLFVLVPHPLC